MEITTILIALFLLGISVLDIFYKKVPSFIMDSFLVVSLSLNLNNVTLGIYGFLFAYLLLDLGLFTGLADLKLIAALSLYASTMSAVWLFIGLICFIGIFYKMGWKRWMKDKTCAFIPVIALAGAIAI
jgi:hypothetical protein